VHSCSGIDVIPSLNRALLFPSPADATGWSFQCGFGLLGAEKVRSWYGDVVLHHENMVDGELQM